MCVHPHGTELYNWKTVVISLPSNITSLFQIMDTSVTESITKHIGLQFFRHLYKLIEEEAGEMLQNKKKI
jgi:hypothetical protein